MDRTFTFLRLVALGLVVLAAAGCDDDDDVLAPVCTPGAALTVSFDDQGTFQTPALMLGGLTINGSANVNVLNLNGLGIVGGVNDNVVDGAEFIRFSVDAGAATSVSYFAPVAGNGDADGLLGEATIEAFNETNGSLGVVAVDGGGTQDVSALFAGETISAFVVATEDGDTLRISRVVYSPCL